MHAVDLVVPGDIDTITGGYIYDRRILAGLTELGWVARVHSLHASFPEPTHEALAVAAAVFAGLPGGATVVIDGLALAGLKDILPPHITRLRLVALIHHPLAYETGLTRERAAQLEAAESAALARVHRVIVTSAWTKRVLETFGVGAVRISVVEPGTDPAPLHRPHPGAPLELLCVASLTKRKGHAVLFDALGKLKGRPWHLTCAGSLTRDPELVASLRAQIERLGLRDRVTFLGELAPEKLGELYARADIFVLASYLEGYGMAFAEALARGIPIVATSGGAIASTVPAAASRLVPPGDVAALAAALAELLDDDAKRACLTEGAAHHRTTLPTWQVASERFANALLEP
ncbi:MAG TPA: glycosyltransferase family 4 protein [Gammaproteobacteria bacterium]|jgi:glycosyltransferase involved in cell wall biosynthesis